MCVCVCVLCVCWAATQCVHVRGLLAIDANAADECCVSLCVCVCVCVCVCATSQFVKATDWHGAPTWLLKRDDWEKHVQHVSTQAVK